MHKSATIKDACLRNYWVVAIFDDQPLYNFFFLILSLPWHQLLVNFLFLKYKENLPASRVDFYREARTRNSIIALRARCSMSFAYKLQNLFSISNEKGNSIYLYQGSVGLKEHILIITLALDFYFRSIRATLAFKIQGALQIFLIIFFNYKQKM